MELCHWLGWYNSKLTPNLALTVFWLSNRNTEPDRSYTIQSWHWARRLFAFFSIDIGDGQQPLGNQNRASNLILISWMFCICKRRWAKIPYLILYDWTICSKKIMDRTEASKIGRILPLMLWHVSSDFGRCHTILRSFTQFLFNK